MTPKEKRAKARDYAVGANCAKAFGVDQVEVADHWLTGFNAGYKAARDEMFEHFKKIPAKVVRLRAIQGARQ